MELGRNEATRPSVLHELQKAKYLSVRSEVVSGKSRKYYDATALGRKALQQAREKLQELAAEVLEEPKKKKLRKRKDSVAG